MRYGWSAHLEVAVELLHACRGLNKSGPAADGSWLRGFTGGWKCSVAVAGQFLIRTLDRWSPDFGEVGVDPVGMAAGAAESSLGLGCTVTVMSEMVWVQLSWSELNLL
jgi:hypothetical protein